MLQKRKRLPLMAALEESGFKQEMSSSVLKVDQLTVAYDGRRASHPAVNGVSLHIGEGEALGLVGESGSGKTTLGRAILRLVDPQSGVLRMLGQDVTALPQSALGPMRRGAQIVFQNPDSSLNPRKTVGEIIARPLVRFASRELMAVNDS